MPLVLWLETREKIAGRKKVVFSHFPEVGETVQPTNCPLIIKCRRTLGERLTPWRKPTPRRVSSHFLYLARKGGFLVGEGRDFGPLSIVPGDTIKVTGYDLTFTPGDDSNTRCQ